MNVPPKLVAHRGYRARYPENTCVALEAALTAGIRHVEFDVQLSADRQPVVVHDAELTRTAGMSGSVLDMTLAELTQIAVGEPDRFGERFAHVRLPSLDTVVALLTRWPACTAFVELKGDSIERFGTAPVIERVLAAIEPVQDRCRLISFDRNAVERARSRAPLPVGWVLESWSEDALEQARRLAPDFLICNYRKVPDDADLGGRSWDWMLYEINEVDLALRYAARGVRYVETMEVGALMSHAELAAGQDT